MRPGQRKSVTALAEQGAPEDGEPWPHLVSTSEWDPSPWETVLAEKANQLVGGPSRHLMVDATALVKQGQCSVAVAPQ